MLFAATHPVVMQYLRQIKALLEQLPDDQDLELRLHPDQFGLGVQLRTAIGFGLRALMPLAGQVPGHDNNVNGLSSLRVFCDVSLTRLAALTAQDFENGPPEIAHRAGFADLVQTPMAYASTFAIPNMLFHFVTALAILRANGVNLGKGDFDGLHHYPKGFSFERSN